MEQSGREHFINPTRDGYGLQRIEVSPPNGTIHFSGRREKLWVDQWLLMAAVQFGSIAGHT